MKPESLLWVPGCNADRLSRAFLVFAGIALFITGASKGYLVFDPTQALDTKDPLFGVPFRYLGISAGFVEVLVSICCLSGRSSILCAVLVAWLATILSLYRVVLLLYDWHLPCVCLGALTGNLPISERTAEIAVNSLLAFLVFGSYLILFTRWLSRKKPESAFVGGV
jgi:hypothetical protein